MHRLANVIRRASIYRQNAKAAGLPLKDALGGDAEAALKTLFEYWIKRDFPAMSPAELATENPTVADPFMSRLATTMLLRRRRILYRRSRQVKLALHTAKPTSKHAPIVPLIRSGLGTSEMTGASPAQTHEHILPVLAPSVAASMPNTATTLDPVTYRREAAKPSKVSLARTVTISKSNKDMIPLPPRIGVGALEFVCPYCCLILPAKDADDKTVWAKHVMKDLDPYVCAFFPCEQGEHLFSTSAEWSAHMKQAHCMRWSCFADTHTPITFESGENYVAHMKAEHPGKFSDRQLPFIARSSKRPAKTIFDECPFCGETNAVTNNNMEDHVAHHLQYVALLSLPFPDDTDDGDDRSMTSMTSSRTETEEAVSRSTLKSTTHDLPPVTVPDDLKSLLESPRLENKEIPEVDKEEQLILRRTWVDVRHKNGQQALSKLVTEDEQRGDKFLEGFVRLADSLKSKAERNVSAGVLGSKEPATALMEPSTTSVKRIWTVPYNRNTTFVDRPAEMERLRTQLTAKDESGARSAVVAGPPGEGKTQLVLEFLYRMQNEDADVSCIWIQATSQTVMQQAFCDTAKHLGILEGEDYGDIDVKYVVSAVHNYLTSKNAGRWFLVLDDWEGILSDLVFGFGSFTSLVASLSRSPQGSVIATTRRMAMGPDTTNACPLTISPMADVQRALRSLSYHLGGHKSYFQLASAYINRNPISVTEYQLLFDKMEYSFLMADGYSNTGHVICLISLIEISQQCPLAGYYISSMAFMQPNRIPLYLLRPWGSDKEQMDAIHVLCAYSLVSISEDDDAAIDIPPWVQDAVRFWIEKYGLLDDWLDIIVTRLARMLPENPSHDLEAMWTKCLPHADAALRATTDKPESEQNVILMFKYGAWLFFQGNIKEAETTLVRAMVSKQRAFRLSDPTLLAIMAKLALVYTAQGLFVEAEDLQKQIAHWLQGTFGPDHPDTLASIADLVSTYKAQQKWKEAETLQDLAATLGNERMSYFCIDCLSGSGRQETVGQFHFDDTLWSMTNLASVYMVQKKWALAEAPLRHVLDNLGELPIEWQALASLADCAREQGRVDEARNFLEQLVSSKEKVLGEYNGDVLDNISRLSAVYVELGMLSQAISNQERVVNGRKNLLGPDDPSTLAAMRDLATTLRLSGQVDENILAEEKELADKSGHVDDGHASEEEKQVSEEEKQSDSEDEKLGGSNGGGQDEGAGRKESKA